MCERIVYCKAFVSPSGHLELQLRKEKPDGIYMGRIATPYSRIEVYASNLYSATGTLALMGRVARLSLKKGWVSDE